MKPERLRIGVSSCLLGRRVRHDGGHKRSAAVGSLRVEFVPVCPEAEAGLGIPRPPIRRVGAKVREVEGGRDVTPLLRRHAAGRLAELSRLRLAGFVFKRRSPSCDPAGGFFARALRRRFPGLPTVHEEALALPAARRRFLARAALYSRRRRA